ncbi:hypothetical protein AAMO2058_000130800 [Amorphochlora amoebiformis]
MGELESLIKDLGQVLDKMEKKHSHSFPNISVNINNTPSETLSPDSTVFIMHGERRDLHVRYMYAPFTRTLLHGFRAIGVTARFIYETNFTSVKETIRNKIKAKDMLIYIGSINPHSRYMKDIKSEKGAYTVLYNTEPLLESHPGPCDKMFHTMFYDEIWDYSWANMDLLGACSSRPFFPFTRYVPPGHWPDSPKVNYTDDSNGSLKLLFFGNANFGSGRLGCFKKLVKQLRPNLSSTYNIWTEDEFERFINKSSATVFLNIQKSCIQKPHHPTNPIHAPPRLNVFLNAHAIVISARSYWKDEEEYSGTISFVEQGTGIGKEYERLKKMNPNDLQALATRRADLFAARFDPEKIFRRAKLPEFFTV